MDGPEHQSSTLIKLSSEAVHQRRRRAAGAGLLAIAAAAVWAITSLGGGSSNTARPNSFAAKVATIGGTGPASLMRKVNVRDSAAIDSVLQTTPYIVKGGGEKKAVALTFDDGPSTYTPQILAILRREGVAGTFFNIGGQESTFGGNSVKAVNSGYIVGDHTFTHPQMSSLSQSDQRSEIDRTATAMTSAGLPAPRLYRAPYGVYDQATLNVLKKNRMLLVLWDIDSLDWSKPGADAIVNNALQGAQNGSIILMHDGGGDRSETVAALPRVIAGLRDRGFSMVTVPTLLAEDPPRAGETPPPSGAGA